ncbi:E3 ubiquitin-protein ligase TRIM38-like [Sorex fumeus]|uniref:E3 ubiquitin-protein ligase TRIM38-like n=1 Tax=Sorex fumeus TaxID=62283 RepID=UPI0024ACD629|nr:E3 ubiquitin-protein ligase TRIM38-like [Sorex fumeus]
MASGAVEDMREEATCPICLELMTEPVMIECGHIYCHSCIMKNLENQQQQSPSVGNFQCPVCRAQFERKNIRPSKQLRNLIDIIKKMEQENLCEEHGEKLNLFCEDDGQLICWCCERSTQHKGHRTVLAADACQGYKENFQKSLTHLRKLEEKNKEWLGNIREQITNFQGFHMILEMEEKSYLWRLENEEEQVLQRLKNSETKLEKQSQELNKHIQELERKCQGSAQDLLQDVRNTLERISAMRLNAPEDVSLDTHSLPHLDSIFSQLFKLFETDIVTLTLDPDTAHNNLKVDQDVNTVFGGRPQVKQDTPTRFKDLPCVLGCETFTSGKYYFKIHFQQGSWWDIGVCLENVPRDNDMRRDPESGFWAIRYCRDDGSVALTSPVTPLFLKDVSFIGVFLDYEAGLVSFYDLDTVSHIFTIPKASFSEPIKPYFCIDPDTAHNDLHVDEDENTVIGGRPQVKHDTPTRFKDLPCVLEYEVITSGKHYFELCFLEGSEWDDVRNTLERISAMQLNAPEDVSLDTYSVPDIDRIFPQLFKLFETDIENLENQKMKSPFWGNFQCPVCRAQFQRESIRPSKQLGNLTDTIKMAEQEHLCEDHREKLSLFCEDDGQLICWCCERTKQHKGQTTILATDACQGYRVSTAQSASPSTPSSFASMDLK